jgi:ABC-2 type transport system ATP-binding protein
VDIDAGRSLAEPLVRLSGVRFSYGRHEVLHGIDLELPPGRITGLVGPSGHGKTTIVNLIVGALRATAGTVEVLGEVAPPNRVRPQIGYMPQSEALYADLTAAENLRFFGALYGLSRAAANERIPQALTAARLGDTGGKLVGEFSGGMKRRLSLAITMLHQPRLFVLDEPTVGLDPAHRVALWHHFRELADMGATFLITTHVMDEAAGCDTLAMVYEGRVIAQGSPAELMAHANVTELEGAFLAYESSSLKAAGGDNA